MHQYAHTTPDTTLLTFKAGVEILRPDEGDRVGLWYPQGAFASFEPGQETTLQADIVCPQGRVHFAGEHCSLHHAWIQGALESGLRAVKEIDEAL